MRARALLRRVSACLLAALIALPAPLLAPVPAPAQSAGRIDRIEFRDAPVGEAVRLLSEIGGVNVFATAAARARRVDITIRDATTASAVAAVARVSRLSHSWDRAAKAWVLMTPEEYAEEIVVVRDGDLRVFTLRNQNVVVAAKVIANLFGDRVTLSLDTEDPDALVVETGSVQESTSTRTGRATFGDDSATATTTSSSAVDAEAERIDRSGLSPALLRRLQALAEDGALGYDVAADALELAPPIAVTISREHNLLYVRTADVDAMEEIARIVQVTDRPSVQVLLEMKILSISRDDDFRSVFNFGLADDGGRSFTSADGTTTSGGTGLSTGNFPLDGGSLFFQILNDNILAQIELLQRDNRVSILSTPLLIASNNAPAELFVGEEAVLVRGISSSTTTGTTGASTTSTSASTELREVGQTLEIIPRVNSDGSVTLAIRQENSAVVPDGASLPVVSTSGSVAEISIDTVNTARISGTVTAMTGATVAFGGLIRTTSSKTEEKVPVLGDIPLLGIPFRGDTEAEAREELVLLITPHVYSSGLEGERIARARLAALSRNGEIDRAGFDGSRGGPPATSEPGQAQGYAPLIRFASARMNGTWSELAGAVESGLRAAAPVRVGIGPITAEPAAAWRRRNLYVTAVLMENTGPVPAPVAFRDLRGRWLAAAADVETLAPAGQEGSRGFLYLVSDRPYDDVLRPIAAGGSL